MNLLNNMKVGNRLLLGFGIITLLMLIATGLAISSVLSINTAIDQTRLEAEKMLKLYSVENIISKVDLDIANMILKADMAEKQGHKAVIDKDRETYAKDIEWLKTNAGTEEGKKLLAALEKATNANKDTNNSMITLSLASKDAEAGKLFTSIAAVDNRANIHQALVELLGWRQERMDGVDKDAEALVSRTNIMLIAFALVALLLAILLSIVISRSVTVALSDSVHFTGLLAQGDFSKDPAEAFKQRKDELGDLARAFQTMVGNIRSLLSNISSSVQTTASSSTELSSVSAQMSSTAADTSSKAQVVSVAAEEMSTNTVSVAAGMEQATTNLRSVATATEEMTATVGEIAGNSEKARRITDQAVTQADQISAAVRELGKSAQEIGKVTETITSISNQTNLLALNATIEAARAGAAGKGFAVVATEIKELAQQTAAATEDIKGKVANVQNSTTSAVGDIEKIASVIREVSDIVSSIATAIEEQSVVTRDIAGNISQAMMGVKDANERVAQTATVSQEVARDIAGVSAAGEQMSQGSAQVRISAEELSKLSEGLNSLIAKFKI